MSGLTILLPAVTHLENRCLSLLTECTVDTLLHFCSFFKANSAWRRQPSVSMWEDRSLFEQMMENMLSHYGNEWKDTSLRKCDCDVVLVKLTKHSSSLAGRDMMIKSFLTSSMTKVSSELSERSYACWRDTNRWGQFVTCGDFTFLSPPSVTTHIM